MDTQSVGEAAVSHTIFIPLHRYTPAESTPDYCGYTIGDKVCGYSEFTSVHSVASVSRRPASDPLGLKERCLEGKPDVPPRQPGERLRYDTHAGTITLDDPMSTKQGLMVFFDKCVELAGKKDGLYRRAWERQGYMGNLSRVLSKVERLRTMLWQDYPELTDDMQETVKDTVQDLANLCGFLARNWEEGNKWGSQ